MIDDTNHPHHQHSTDPEPSTVQDERTVEDGDGEDVAHGHRQRGRPAEVLDGRKQRVCA